MRTIRRLLLPVLLLPLPVALPQGKVWVVDAAGGPGTDLIP